VEVDLILESVGRACQTKSGAASEPRYMAIDELPRTTSGKGAKVRTASWVAEKLQVGSSSTSARLATESATASR